VVRDSKALAPPEEIEWPFDPDRRQVVRAAGFLPPLE
jgi:hypothetical protein